MKPFVFWVLLVVENRPCCGSLQAWRNRNQGRYFGKGKDLVNVPAYQRNFGLVFQDYALFPHLDVAGNIAFGLRMKNVSLAEIDQRVDSLLESVNLPGFRSRRVTDLSGGEQQRVALARAMAPNPRLLMFDEPLGDAGSFVKR